MRALTACAAIVAAAFALGLPSVPGLQPGSAVPERGTSRVAVPALAPVILTDGSALVPFARTLVRTVAKDGQAPLNVASAQLGRPPEGSLMAPLEILEASSPFGLRISPISGQGGDFHLGQDFAAGCGTRVYAADAGVVRAAGWHPWGGGNRVEIDHGNGLITTYNHLQAVAVHTGDSVQVGQVIARVGTTGWSTGCHLHFETILRGVHTNPLNWTLLPIHQVDMLADISMVSYEGKDAATSQPWAIPVAADNSHAVLHGDDELPAPPAAHAEPATTPTEAATPAAASSPTETATPTGTATPTATGTAAPSQTATKPPTPSGTASPTGSATPTPSGTATPTGTATPSPTATGTATPTASPSGTTAPAASTPPFPGASAPTTTAPAAPRPVAPVATSAPAARTPSESEQPVTPPSTTPAAAAPPGTTTPSAETTTSSAPEPAPTKP